MQRHQSHKQHLRQRSLRLNERTERDYDGPGSDFGSPSIQEEDPFFNEYNNASTSSSAGPPTPGTLESGMGLKQQQQQQQQRPRSQTLQQQQSQQQRPRSQTLQQHQQQQPEVVVYDQHGSPSKPRPYPQRASSLNNGYPMNDSDTSLPLGATTPLESVTYQGFPIQTYPPPPPTWGNMPNKPQLAILALSRFVDFFQMAALQTYMVHQLKSFDPSQSDSEISRQAGFLQGSFTAAQIITSILWGRAADQPGVGRKMVLMIGLVGTGLSCIGVGFSSSFGQAVVWRVLGGAINGTVGAARTMVAESVDKRWHPRAFLLLPAAFNIANVLGPILSGILVEPVKAYPHLFGPNSSYGGVEGIKWMETHPYAVANLLSTILLWLEAALCYFFLNETLKGFRNVEISNFDPIRLGKGLWRSILGVKNKGYEAIGETVLARRGLLSDREEGSIELDRIAENSTNEKGQDRPPQRLPFKRIWTPNVCWTLVSIAIFDFHMGAFANLWILFLSTAREFVPDADNNNNNNSNNNGIPGGGAKVVARSAFKFAGGLAFPPPTIGFAMAIIGFIGIALQFLLYPYANGRFGLMRCFRSSLFLFPLAYFLAPYIALLPSTSTSPAPSSGFYVWAGIATVVFLQVAARTFALPASIILLNNSSPHPSVLATIHGLGQADSATFRTIGPIISSFWFGEWLDRGVVGMAWWYVAVISAVGAAASFKVRNGSGHEILLPGEEERAEDATAALGAAGSTSTFTGGGGARSGGGGGLLGPK